MSELLLVRYGEIALKGKNRRYFEKKYISNIKKAVKHIENTEVIDRSGRSYVRYEKNDEEKVIKAVTNVFGVVSVSVAETMPNDLALFCESGLKKIHDLMAEQGYQSFKVEVNRVNKKFPMTSPEISKEIGGYILTRSENLKVDVHHPDVFLNFEIREQTYMFVSRIPGPGGMPYGTSGKGMLLLSGGIDSPVAGYQMARRGVELEAIHFHSYPFTSERAFDKVLDLGRVLSEYTQTLRVYSVNLLDIQTAIGDRCPDEEMTILSRRMMMQIAERIALKDNCKCLITGENLAQVASQTMEGLTVTNASVELPVLRPLIAYDKNEIISFAKKLGTYETSILPYEDCCTVFLPKKVVTKPKLDKIENSELLIDKESLIERAIENMSVTIIVEGKVVSEYNR